MFKKSFSNAGKPQQIHLPEQKMLRKSFRLAGKDHSKAGKGHYLLKSPVVRPQNDATGAETRPIGWIIGLLGPFGGPPPAEDQCQVRTGLPGGGK